MLIKDLLDDFSTQVKNHYYEKIDYNKWRELVSHKEEIATVLYYPPDDKLIYLFVSANTLNYGLQKNYEFLIDDNSLGEYLYNHRNEFSYACDSVNYCTTSTSSSGASTGNIATTMPSTYTTINTNDKKENNNMNFTNKFDFGSCEKDNVRMSPYGLACKNANGTWVSYKTQTGEVMDVDIFNFEGQKYLFKLPVAISAITAGDLIIHNKHPMFVVAVAENHLDVVDVVASERKTILPIKSPFGFDFYTKVVSLFDTMTPAAAESPFGNMLPFFLLNDNSDSSDNLLPLLLMQNGTTGFSENPAIMYLLLNNKNNNDNLLPLMFLMNQNKK